MSSDLGLPESVCGIIDDAGFTSPLEMIKANSKEKIHHKILSDLFTQFVNSVVLAEQITAIPKWRLHRKLCSCTDEVQVSEIERAVKVQLGLEDPSLHQRQLRPDSAGYHQTAGSSGCGLQQGQCLRSLRQGRSSVGGVRQKKKAAFSDGFQAWMQSCNGSGLRNSKGQAKVLEDVQQCSKIRSRFA